MRYSLFILLLFAGIHAFGAQPDSARLRKAVVALNSALIKKDTVQLKMLLKDDIHYIHSNGWMELKKDVINDLYNGKLTYKKINVSSEKIGLNGTVGTVEMEADLDVLLDGKPVQLKLKINQLWTWKNDRWELFTRRSIKI